ELPLARRLQPLKAAVVAPIAVRRAHHQQHGDDEKEGEKGELHWPIVAVSKKYIGEIDIFQAIISSRAFNYPPFASPCPFSPNGSTVRRFLRPIVIAVVTLALALGAGVGLAAPAYADTDTAFTAAIDPTALPLTVNSSGAITFGGAKGAGETITSETTNVGADIGACTGTDSASAAWSCTFVPNDSWNTGNYSIVISETNADGVVVQNVLAFQIYVNGEAPSTPTTPVTGVQFTPGGANLSTTATG